MKPDGLVLGSVAALVMLAGCSSSASSSDPSADPTVKTDDPSQTPDPGPGPGPGTGTDSGTNTDAGTKPDGATTPPAKSGSGTYESNLGDFTFTIGDILARYKPAKAKNGGFESELNIKFLDRAGACGDFQSGIRHASYSSIEIEINHSAASQQAAELTAGTYTFGKNPDGEVSIERRTHTATCESTGMPELPPASFMANTIAVNKVVITSLTATHVTGSYELRANDGKYVKGTFDSDLCAGSSPSTQSCVP